MTKRKFRHSSTPITFKDTFYGKLDLTRLKSCAINITKLRKLSNDKGTILTFMYCQAYQNCVLYSTKEFCNRRL